MKTMVVRKDMKKEKGQALFEFIVFLPLLLILFAFMVSIGNSINASINQQKTVRAYFYYLLKGNSRAPTVSDLSGMGYESVGMSVLGWQRESIGSTPIAPCFKLSSFFGELNPGETCGKPQVGEGISQFIRVYTAYGICSENYIRRDDGSYRATRMGTGVGSCTNQN